MTALFKPDRFDIEQEINQVGHFSDIIKNYAIHTTLHGFANLLEAHSEKMSETHCKHYDLNEYS